MTAKKLVAGDEFIFLRFSLSPSLSLSLSLSLAVSICSRIFGVGVCVLKKRVFFGGGGEVLFPGTS